MDKNFSADSTLQGGIFETIKSSTEVNYTSSVEANEVIVEKGGDIFVEGRLNAPYIKVSGTLDIMDTIESEDIIIHEDALLISGDNIVSQNIKNDGGLEVNQSIKADELKTSGRLSVKKTVDCTTFQSTGELQSEDEIIADKIHIKVHENSFVKYLSGNEISIKAKREGLIFKDDDAILEVHTIDGSDVYVENVSCEMVRGDRVKVGPNCRINVIEYTESYDFDQSSEVHELGKISRK